MVRGRKRRRDCRSASGERGREEYTWIEDQLLLQEALVHPMSPAHHASESGGIELGDHIPHWSNFLEALFDPFELLLGINQQFFVDFVKKVSLL